MNSNLLQRCGSRSVVEFLLIGPVRFGKLNNSAEGIFRRNEGLHPLGILVVFADDAIPTGFEFGNQFLKSGNAKRQMVHAFSALSEKLRDKSAIVEGFEEFDLRSVWITILLEAEAFSRELMTEEVDAAENVAIELRGLMDTPDR